MVPFSSGAAFFQFVRDVFDRGDRIVQQDIALLFFLLDACFLDRRLGVLQTGNQLVHVVLPLHAFRSFGMSVGTR